MELVYFVSVNDIKENSTIDYAVEDKLLKNSIIDAQNIDIQYLLGSKLYIKLQDLIKTGDISTEAEYKTLLDDYVFNALLKAVEKRVILTIWAKIRNTGIVNQDNENSTPVDITVINKLRSEIGNDYEFYANLLKDYLCDSNIEEYDNSDGIITASKDDQYFNGLVL